MRNKPYLTVLILSTCISLSVCPKLSGRINKVRGYGSFAACDTWQKWVEHITGGDFKFTGFARNDDEECEELAAYVYDSFMTNAGDDEWYDEEDCFTMYTDEESTRPYHVEPDEDDCEDDEFEYEDYAEYYEAEYEDCPSDYEADTYSD